MSSIDRQQELEKYEVIDTLPEIEFDDIVELASIICDAPISFISFIDQNRLWFKAKIGLSINEVPYDQSICQYAVDIQDSIYIVEDVFDEKISFGHPLWEHDPEIGFYAGIPLNTSEGVAIGTFCVLDVKARKLLPNQEKSLKLLAKMLMQRLEMRKDGIRYKKEKEEIETLFQKIADKSPGAIYQFEMKPNGSSSFPFISQGISEIHPGLTPEKLKLDASHGFDTIHQEDIPGVLESIKQSMINLTTWEVEYRVKGEDGNKIWHKAKAQPELKENGSVVWYGTFQDISQSKEDVESLEDILFSISHVIRRPIASMLGLIQAMDSEKQTEESIKFYIEHFKRIFQEFEAHSISLNELFVERKNKIKNF